MTDNTQNDGIAGHTLPPGADSSELGRGMGWSEGSDAEKNSDLGSGSAAGHADNNQQAADLDFDADMEGDAIGAGAGADLLDFDDDDEDGSLGESGPMDNGSSIIGGR